MDDKLVIEKNEQIMMSLVHYFITKEDYAPINVQGVKDEIWLENLDGPYRIIRINSNLIINEEQYKFDVFKVKHILKEIKKKTLSFKMNALNICLDMNEKYLSEFKDNIDTIIVDSINEIKSNPILNEMFPNIENELLIPEDQLDLLLNVTTDINEKTKKESNAFTKVFSPKKIVFTKVIMILCLLMYFIVSFYGSDFLNASPNVLALFGANNIMLVKNGELWRLLTSAFLHVGLLHLLVNMYSLVIIGTQVETFLGKFKFVFIYLVSAICGSLMSLIFLPDNVVGVGASGAIFGLMGSLLYFGYHYRMYLSSAIRNQIIPIVVINLLIGFMASGIDNACHIGGLIGGYLATMAIGVSDKSTRKDMINGWIVLILYVCFMTFVVFTLR